MTRLLLIVAALMAVPCLALEVGEPVQLSAAGVTATGIDIATDGDGIAYVVWAQKGPPQPGRGHASDDDLFLARWAADERRPASINRVNPRAGEAKSSAVSRARVAVDEEGVVHVLYPANAVSPVTGKPAIDVRYARSLDGGRRFAAPESSGVRTRSSGPSGTGTSRPLRSSQRDRLAGVARIISVPSPSPSSPCQKGARIFFLSTLPRLVRGIESQNSTDLGTTSGPFRSLTKAVSSSSVACLPW